MTERRDHIHGRPIPRPLVELRDLVDHLIEVTTDLNGVEPDTALELVRKSRRLPKLTAHVHDLVMLLAKSRGLGYQRIAQYLGLRGHRGIQNEVYRAQRHWPRGLEQCARTETPRQHNDALHLRKKEQQK